MNDKCTVNQITIENLEKRVEKLERQQENDYHEITENNKQLAIIVNDLKNITKLMENITTGWQNAISNSEEKHELEKRELSGRITTLETNMAKLNDKIDNRTIGKASELWDKAKWIVISSIITGVITLIVSNILK
mgnify:CR=1 FL=1